MINRRKAREYAFILLFEYRFQPDCMQEILDDFLAENNAGEQGGYIRTAVEGAIDHLTEIDGLIEQYAKGWSLNRISVVCMAAMRLAIYEMRYIDDVPAGVAINEAIALVKKFDGEESVDFVNGILGRIKEEQKV